MATAWVTPKCIKKHGLDLTQLIKLVTDKCVEFTHDGYIKSGDIFRHMRETASLGGVFLPAVDQMTDGRLCKQMADIL